MYRHGKLVWEVRTIFMITISVLAMIGNARADFVFGEPIVTETDFVTAPSISTDGLTMYGDAPDESGWGIWVKTRETIHDDWPPIASAIKPTPPNSSYADGDPDISADGLTLFFNSDRPGGLGGWDIWQTTRVSTDDPWSEPVHLGPKINGPYSDTGPSISADGLSLVFSSDRPGGYGDQDIYLSTRATVSDPWLKPMNLGPIVNSPSIDSGPDISSDGLTLFFASDRPGGYGLDDIYVTRRATTDGAWGASVNLGPIVNDSNYNFTPGISADGSIFHWWSQIGRLRQAPIIPIVDFNGDGKVDSEDESILMDHCGQNAPLCDIGPTPLGDGIVDIQDLCVLAEYVDVKDVVLVHTPSVHAADVPHDVILQWLPAEIADTHDVYFGTNFEDVEAADRDDPRDVLVSQDHSANAFDPGPLAFGQTYHWRIDEVTATFEPTIYKGVVMDFTTEPLGYPIDNVSATASTSEAGAGPENTVNGSGLRGDDTHSTAATDMWGASGNGVDPIWIQYEFDQVYKLHEMLVWNYNVMFELMLGFGLKDVTVEYSENGMDWTVLGDVELAQATATSTYTANTTIDLGGVAAKYVRLTVNSGWGMMGKYGLSEVRFYHIPTRARKPEPGDGETGVSPDTILSWHAGREAALHEVYLGTDRQAVVNGTALVDTVTENSYLPGPLDPGQTYYWKINEVNEAEALGVWEGDIWEFTTAE